MLQKESLVELNALYVKKNDNQKLLGAGEEELKIANQLEDHSLKMTAHGVVILCQLLASQRFLAKLPPVTHRIPCPVQPGVH